MMLNVWINVLVVGMAAGERWIVGVFLRIIPIELLRFSPNFIAITFDNGILKVNPFFDKETDIVFKKDLARKFAKHPSGTFQDES